MTVTPAQAAAVAPPPLPVNHTKMKPPAGSMPFGYLEQAWGRKLVLALQDRTDFSTIPADTPGVDNPAARPLQTWGAYQLTELVDQAPPTSAPRPDWAGPAPAAVDDVELDWEHIPGVGPDDIARPGESTDDWEVNPPGGSGSSSGEVHEVQTEAPIYRLVAPPAPDDGGTWVHGPIRHIDPETHELLPLTQEELRDTLHWILGIPGVDPRTITLDEFGQFTFESTLSNASNSVRNTPPQWLLDSYNMTADQWKGYVDNDSSPEKVVIRQRLDELTAWATEQIANAPAGSRLAGVTPKSLAWSILNREITEGRLPGAFKEDWLPDEVAELVGLSRPDVWQPAA